MTMMLQLLIVSVAVSLIVDALVPVPQYRHYLEAVVEATEILNKNLLSMEGNIPFLDDYRRDYAEIVHVINYHGIMNSDCRRWGYYDDYQQFLAISAPEALTNPDKVVTETGTLMYEVHVNTTKIKGLIDACKEKREMCDVLVHDTVNKNEDQYGRQADILIAVGCVAEVLNANNEKFERVSKDLEAHQYVCTSPKDLEIIVFRVAVLHQVLYSLYSPVPRCYFL